jgi:phthiocerol/phenolphthiocerol synthesis type-I polyketide synthase B
VDWLYEPTWPARALPAGPDAPTGRWLVLGDQALAAELGGIPAAGDAPDNVLFAPPPGGSSIDIASAHELFNEARRVATECAAMAAPPKLYFLTRNAQPVAAGDRANPVHAVLWGLGRTLALEHPEVWAGVIDVDESMPAVLAARQLRTLDLTGGAPELHPHFRSLVKEARDLGVEVIDRCNLTVMVEPSSVL